SVADPRSFSNADPATWSDALCNDWHGGIFVRVIVVQDQDVLSNVDVTFQVDSVLGGYNSSTGYDTVVIDHDRRLTGGVPGCDIEPGMVFHADRITEADPGRALPGELT